MRNFLFYILLSLAYSVAFTSCSSDIEELERENQAYRVVAFELQLEEEQTTRTATGLLNPRDEMESIQLFFYLDEQLVWKAPTLTKTAISQVQNQTQVQLQIPIDIAQKLEGQQPTLFVLVNCEEIQLSAEEQTLTQLQKKLISSPNLNTQAESFLMSGLAQLSNPLQFDKELTQLGPIVVQRAAAQVVLLLGSAQAEGHQATSVEARLMQINTTTSLDAQYPAPNRQLENTEYAAVDQTISYQNQTYQTTAASFYSYENNWEQQPDSRNTYLLLKVYFEGTEQAYYYRVPVYYESLGNQIQRNHGYLIKVNIEEFGTVSDQRPLDLEGEIELFPFHGISIEAHLDGASYLFVKDSEPRLYYKKEDEIAVEYISDSEVSWVLEKEYYYNAQSIEVNITPMGEQPKGVEVILENIGKKTYLRFVKLNPQPYITQELDFHLSNSSGAYAKLHLTLMGNYIVIPHQSGIEGKPVYEIKYTVSDGSIVNYPTTEDGKTKNDDMSNRIVSPNYYFSPEDYTLTLGVYLPNRLYLDAETYCKGLSVQMDGKTLGGPTDSRSWRVPSHNELHILATVYMRSKFYPMDEFNDFYLCAKAERSANGVTQMYSLAITTALRAFHAEGLLGSDTTKEPSFAALYTSFSKPTFTSKQVNEREYYRNTTSFNLNRRGQVTINQFKLRCVYDK